MFTVSEKDVRHLDYEFPCFNSKKLKNCQIKSINERHKSAYAKCILPFPFIDSLDLGYVNPSHHNNQSNILATNIS